MANTRMSVFLLLGLLMNPAIINLTSGLVTSFNSLVRADKGMFPANMDTISPSSDVLPQLKSMMSNPLVLSVVYSNYLNNFDKKGRQSSSVFAQNLVGIAEHNLVFDKGETSWDKGVNQFTDMSGEERRQYSGSDVPLNFNSTAFLGENLESSLPQLNFNKLPRSNEKGAPASLDWRTEGGNGGVVTPVKYQDNCGSCWAFSAVSVLESSYAKANGGEKLDLSEQELVDCDTRNSACQGGAVNYAFDYMKSNGVTSEDSYPYKKKKQSCQRKSAVAKVKSYGQVRREGEFKEAIATYGPVAVSVVCSNEWYDYKSGVYDGSCGKEGHAVNIVGYGSESGKDYWIIKNSWDTRWGEKGYMKLIAGKDKCTVASRRGAYWVTA